VLVVDDDAMVRWIIVEELQEAGCEVVEATDGNEGLVALSEHGPFDVMLTDIRMPNLDGWDLAERARETFPGLPILYVSGWSDCAPRPVSNSAIIVKPFRPAALVQAVMRTAKTGIAAS
jgi:two-component system cell cycle sensor histidine kinase/response regulator CckA